MSSPDCQWCSSEYMNREVQAAMANDTGSGGQRGASGKRGADSNRVATLRPLQHVPN
jgi:hypothetical protein